MKFGGIYRKRRRRGLRAVFNRLRRRMRFWAYVERIRGLLSLQKLILEGRKDPLLRSMLLNMMAEEHCLRRDSRGGYRYEVDGKLVCKLS